MHFFMKARRRTRRIERMLRIAATPLSMREAAMQGIGDNGASALHDAEEGDAVGTKRYVTYLWQLWVIFVNFRGNNNDVPNRGNLNAFIIRYRLGIEIVISR